jgi:hypothetical protein
MAWWQAKTPTVNTTMTKFVMSRKKARNRLDRLFKLKERESFPFQIKLRWLSLARKIKTFL